MPVDAIKNAARRLIAGEAWHTAREVESLIAAEVPDELAKRTYERLARARGKKTSDASEQVAIGRSRIVREKLQRLVTDGEAEAFGEGEERSYRLIGDHGMTRPKPRRESIAFERLTFDARLQMRVLPEGKVFSEDWVQHLIDMKKEGAEFAPLEAVDDGKRLWVFAGFNRGEMYRRSGDGEGPNTVEVLIYPGTFKDAQLYALSENSRHGLNRRPEDCRKAFTTLIESKDLLGVVLERAKAEKGKDEGGVHRAIAAACGISNSIVGKYLKDAKLRVTRSGKLEAIPDSPPAPPVPDEPTKAEPETLARASEDAEPKKNTAKKSWREKSPAEAGLGGELHEKTMVKLDQAGIDTCGELADRLLAGEELGLMPGSLEQVCKIVERLSAGDAKPIRFGTEPEPEPEVLIPEGHTPGQGMSLVGSSLGEPLGSNSIRDTIENAQKHLRGLVRAADMLFGTIDSCPHLVRLAAQHGLPTTCEEQERMLNINQSVMQKTYSWPVLAKLTAIFADVSAQAFQPLGRAG